MQIYGRSLGGVTEASIFEVKLSAPLGSFSSSDRSETHYRPVKVVSSLGRRPSWDVAVTYLPWTHSSGPTSAEQATSVCCLNILLRKRMSLVRFLIVRGPVSLNHQARQHPSGERVFTLSFSDAPNATNFRKHPKITPSLHPCIHFQPNKST